MPVRVAYNFKESYHGALILELLELLHNVGKSHSICASPYPWHLRAYDGCIPRCERGR